MLEELWNNYGWIVLVIGLIILNILFLRPTGKIISGFHRGVNYTKKETYGDIAQGIIFLIFIGYIIYLLIRSFID